MSKLTKFQKYLLAGLSVAGGISLYYLNQSRPRHQVEALWTPNYEYSPISKWDSNWDHRQPESCIKPRKLNNSTIEDDNKYNEKLEKLKPKVTRHLLLIRHGQYNLEGSTDKERVLTEIGRKQAFYTGQRLKELQFPYTSLIRSTMTRAQETSSIILQLLQGIKVQDCNFLVEGAPIPPEPSVGNWKPESYQFFEDGARIEAAFRKYFHRESPHEEKDTYTILVCHANVIRYFVCRALQFPPEAWLRFSLNHASITWISISPSGRVLLRTYGDSGHIPVEFTSR